MPLSPPALREHLHTRAITARGYRRADGMFDIEGHLADTKTYSFPNKDRGEVQAGEPVHGMWLRFTVTEDLVLHDVEAFTEHAPFAMCGDIAPAFKKLVGLKLKPGFNARVKEMLGGVHGCTHLVDMVPIVATTAIQTIGAWLYRNRRRERLDTGGRPFQLGQCHAYAPDSPVIKREHPDWYTGPAGD